MARAHYPRGDRTAGELAAMLADRAGDFCRTYLPGGGRNGRYWRVGSVDGEPGQSLWVNLRGNDRGKWKDEAVPGHGGDLLDLIRAAKGIGMPAAMDEAARFLGLAPPKPAGGNRAFGAMLRDAVPVAADDPAGLYLASRGLDAGDAEGCLFHPTLWVKLEDGVREQPALIVPLTAADGTVHALHRIFVSPEGTKPDFERHKRTKGSGPGLAARFGPADAERVVLCEGVEDALAVVRALGPDERAGGNAWDALRTRWGDGNPGVVLVRAIPEEKDANDELLKRGPEALRALLAPLFAAEADRAEGIGDGDMPTESPAAEGNPDGDAGSEEIGAEGVGKAGGGPHTRGGTAEDADGPGEEAADAAAGAREWAAFIRDWAAFREGAERGGIHPHIAPGYGHLHARMRVLSSRDGLDGEARAWLGGQLAAHNAVAGRRKRAEEHILALRIVADRRQAIAASGGDILRAGRYGAWKEEEGRLREIGAAMLADPAYGPMLDGIEHSREWIKWADRAIPSWHAEEAQRLEALQGASVRR